MAGFLYFLPNARYVDLDRFGLLHIRDRKNDPLHACQVVANGPGGNQGLVIGAADRWDVSEVKQVPGSIEWVQFPKSHAPEQAFCGWYKDRLPAPKDVARADQLPGEWLTLADDNRWLVPIARDFEGSCKVPRVFDLDPNSGEWVPARVANKYAKLWQHAIAFYQAQFDAAIKAKEEGNSEFSFLIPDHESLVIDTLAVNYRVSARELACMGVLATGVVSDIASVIIGDCESVKKKEQGLNTGNS